MQLTFFGYCKMCIINIIERLYEKICCRITNIEEPLAEIKPVVKNNQPILEDEIEINKEAIQQSELDKIQLEKELNEELNQGLNEESQNQGLNEESQNQESQNQEPLNEEPLNEESLNEESLNEESLNQEPLNEELIQQELDRVVASFSKQVLPKSFEKILEDSLVYILSENKNINLKPVVESQIDIKCNINVDELD